MGREGREGSQSAHGHRRNSTSTAHQLHDPGQSLLIPETRFPDLQNGANETTLLFLNGGAASQPYRLPQPALTSGPRTLASHSCPEGRLGPPWTARAPGLSVAMFPLQGKGASLCGKWTQTKMIIIFLWGLNSLITIRLHERQRWRGPAAFANPLIWGTLARHRVRRLQLTWLSRMRDTRLMCKFLVL